VAENVTGIVRINVNGQLQSSLPGATIVFGGVVRTAHSGHGYYGMSEAFRPASLRFTIVHQNSTDIRTLGDSTEKTLMFECDSGPVYTITAAKSTTPGELNTPADGATMEWEFIGEQRQ
jgi:hypothetical protein